MPAPQTYYTSPLDRCCHTAQITFSNLTLPSDQPFVPTVKELLREVNGVHTCDKRSTRTYIHTTYPTYVIEPSLTENDELWSPKIRESDSQLDARLKSLLDDIFTNDESTWISLTSHSAAIGSMLRVLGHREFRLKTGAVMPVLVKAETLSGPEPERPVQPGIPVEECVGDETTSYDSVFRKAGV
jgi:broad specificity phosphatase PhoE